MIARPEGTQDLLPQDALLWRFMRATADELFARYGYQPVETPVIELTELFVRGIGEATDVVSKEMFQAISGENLKTLLDGGTLRSSRRLSLRPEGTAGAVRAIAGNGLVAQGSPPVKLAYAGPMFRAERPQKDRYRQFNQIGVECIGAEEPSIDAEGIIMMMEFFEAVGIDPARVTLLVNSMGCGDCRPAYRDLVRRFILDHADQLCEECVRRAQTNPLRAFDCKRADCAAVMAEAPAITDHLCDDCRAHYETLKGLLDEAGLSYTEDSRLVRGLDYYTRTVFEVQVNEGMGAQNAIGGGGRYDGLMEQIGAKPAPGFGFALGFERCRSALEAQGAQLPAAPAPECFVACVDPSVKLTAFSLLQSLRRAGISAEMDHQGRSLKSQFKLAGRLGIGRVVVVGPDELAQDSVTVRDMEAHKERLVPLSSVVEALSAELDGR